MAFAASPLFSGARAASGSQSSSHKGKEWIRRPSFHSLYKADAQPTAPWENTQEEAGYNTKTLKSCALLKYEMETVP